MKRRGFIQLAGGGAVLAALPLAGCSSSYPPEAVQAWTAGAPDGDIRHWMLAHALLAPNPHNRQPWIADLRTDRLIQLVCDGDRLLPETDPFGRQILVGCGAFIELAVIAAAERGHRVRVEAFPDGEPDLQQLPRGRVVARLSVDKDTGLAPDALFAQIRHRHTNKGAYDSARAVAAPVWQALQHSATAHGLLAGAVTDAPGMDRVRQITRASYEVEMTTPRTYLESAHLLRIGPREIEQHRDGISLNSPFVRALSALGMFDRFEVPQRGSSNHARVMERWAPFETGSGYFWIASQGNTRRAQLDAGRAYVRAHLHATAAGVDMQPLSQALQEFAEVKPHFDALPAALGLAGTGHTVQMLARVGYGKEAAPASPRRELKALLRA